MFTKIIKSRNVKTLNQYKNLKICKINLNKINIKYKPNINLKGIMDEKIYIWLKYKNKSIKNDRWILIWFIGLLIILWYISFCPRFLTGILIKKIKHFQLSRRLNLKVIPIIGSTKIQKEIIKYIINLNNLNRISHTIKNNKNLRNTLTR